MTRERRFFVFAAAAVVLFLFTHSYWGRIAGEVRGAELELLEVDGVLYHRDDGDHHQQFFAADADRYLGRALNGGKPRLWVYTVKDDPDRDFLYVRDGYDGTFYVRESLTTGAQPSVPQPGEEAAPRVEAAFRD